MTALGDSSIVWSNGERVMAKTTDKYTFTFHTVEEREEAIGQIRDIIFKTLEDEEVRSHSTPQMMIPGRATIGSHRSTPLHDA
jgi:hypothetical protein